jgi:sulfide dehydrogenase [flavocytochrome c] flavoprotein chain
MHLKRRSFLATGAAASLALSAPAVLGQGRPRVIVIGGGCGGATAARYLASESDGAIDVVLIEPQRTYNTCFFGNLYIGGFWALEDTGFTYANVAKGGVNVIHEFAVGVDRDARTVTLGSGATLSYDRLVVSPGIDFREESVPGWSLAAQDVMPHAYKGGTQVALLKAQVEAMPQGGTFAMVAPPNPYRCPPGPYERISMVAWHLKQANPTAKILLIDPKETYSKQALWEEGWLAHYPGMIERVGPEFGAETVEVRPDTMEVVIDGDATKVDVCNVIPGQRAGNIAAIAGLTNDAGWAPVKPADMRSAVDENVWVLGDASQQGDMPKSGLLGQQPGQGRGHGDPGRAHRVAGLPRALRQHLLVAHRRERRREGRRLLRADGGEDRLGHQLREPAGRGRGAAPPDLRGKPRLVRGHHRRHVRLTSRARGVTAPRPPT